MYELTLLREHIQTKNYQAALTIVDELEEMSLSDKVNKINSYAIILLLHLIKRHAEKRTTRSWDVSIANSCYHIRRTNKRRKAGGYYLPREDMVETLHEAFPIALRNAALEAFEGAYDAAEIAAMIDRSAIEAEALQLIWFDPDVKKAN